MTATSTAGCEVQHRVTRCLLTAHNRGHASGPESKDLQAWFGWEEEAFRYGVDSGVSHEDLAALIEGSTVKLEAKEHRAYQSVTGDFVRWGRLGGLETLRRYGRPWFPLLARRRWERVRAETFDHYRVNLMARAGTA